MLSRTSLSCCGVKDVSNVNGGNSATRPRQSGPSMAMKVSKPKKNNNKNDCHFIHLKNVKAMGMVISIMGAETESLHSKALFAVSFLLKV